MEAAALQVGKDGVAAKAETLGEGVGVEDLIIFRYRGTGKTVWG